jgi:hypothetical protein
MEMLEKWVTPEALRRLWILKSPERFQNFVLDKAA